MANTGIYWAGTVANASIAGLDTGLPIAQGKAFLDWTTPTKAQGAPDVTYTGGQPSDGVAALSPEGMNPVKAAYLYLRTLGSFADAVEG